MGNIYKGWTVNLLSQPCCRRLCLGDG